MQENEREVGTYDPREELPAGGSYTWAWSAEIVEGEDDGSFTVTGSGRSVGLGFRNPPDYESSAHGPTYVVTIKGVQSSGGAFATVTQRTTVTVTDVDEEPTVTGGPTVSIPESVGSEAGAEPGPELGSYEGEDPEGANLTWSVVPEDGAFELTGRREGARVLRFKSGPDFEGPGTDGGTLVGRERVYEVTVKAADGPGSEALSGTQSVTVTVTDVNEDGTVTLSPDPGADPAPLAVGTRLTATLSDPDRGVSGVAWRWQRRAEGGDWGNITDNGNGGGYMAVAADVGHRLRATVSYTDVHGPGQSAESVRTGLVEAADVNEGTITLSSPPQTCAQLTATLTDADGGIRTVGSLPDGFTYGWVWDPPSASSSRTAGTSTTQSYLPPNSAVGRPVSVTVQYGDNASNRNTATLTSGAVQANAPRSISGFTATGGRRRVDLAWTAPSNDCGATVTYTYRYRLSGSTTWTTLTTMATSASIPSLAAGTYEFELTAGNSAGDSGTLTDNATVTASPGTITLSSPPQTCAQLTATLTDADGGIMTVGSLPDGFTYGWVWDPPSASSSRTAGTSTTQSYLPPNSAVGRPVSVTVQYGDNASNRNTATLTSGAVLANAPRSISGFTATGGRRRADLAWTAPSNDCGATVTYTYRYRLSGSTTWTTLTTMATSASITSLAAGTYEFELTAGNSAGDSGTLTDNATVTASPGTITLSSPPQTCAQLTATLTDADGGIMTVGSLPDGFTYGWIWDPPSASSSRTAGTSTTQSYLPPNSAVGRPVSVTVQYGDNASNRNTATLTSGAVLANAPRSISGFTATGGRRRADLAWTAPSNDCGATVTYTYRYRLSGSTTWTTLTTMATSASITSLAAGTYEFELTAGNSAGDSGTLTDNATVTASPGTITLSSPPQTCAHLTATLTDADGGIMTVGSLPDGFTYGWVWDPPSASSSRTAGTSTTQSYLPPNSAVGRPVSVTVQYGDNASNRNTATLTSGAVLANVPRSISGFTATGGRRRVDLAWTAPSNDCGATVTYSYRYRLSGSTTWTSSTTTSTSAALVSLAAGTYSCEVKAVNSAGESGTLTDNATVQPLNRAPTVTGISPVTVDEGTTTVGSYTGTDPDGDVLTWTTTNSTVFQVQPGSSPSGSSTTLSFRTAPDYEALTNRTFTVTVKATDSGSASSTRAVTVTVTNVDEPGTVTLSDSSPHVGDQLTATLTDPDQGIRQPTWSWTSGGTGARSSSVQSLRYTVPVGDFGKILKASVGYTDDHGPGKSASRTSSALVGAHRPDPPPDFDAARGDGQVVLTWGQADGNGAPITGYGYRYRSDTGSWPSRFTSISGRTVTISLTNGTLYHFQVQARSIGGASSSSEDSATPAGTPGAPQSLATDRQGGNGFMELTWEAAAANGSPILAYYYRYKKTGDEDWRGWYRRTGGANARSKSWTNFDDGSAYVFQVRARNGVDYGTTAQISASALGPGGSRGARDEHEETEDELMPEGEVPEPGDDVVVFAKPVAEEPEVEWLAGADSLAVRPGPNPFNPETTLRFQLPEAAPVTLTIHNTAGQRVAEMIRGEILAAGLHERAWSGTDEAGRPVASGLYLYRLVAGDQVRVGKLALIR